MDTVRIDLAALQRIAAERPGFLEMILPQGRIEGDALLLTPERYNAIIGSIGLETKPGRCPSCGDYSKRKTDHG